MSNNKIPQSVSINKQAKQQSIKSKSPLKKADHESIATNARSEWFSVKKNKKYNTQDEETTIKHLPKIYPLYLNKERRNHHQKYRIVQNNLSPKKTSRISRSLEQTDLKKIKIINNLQNKQMQNMTVLKRQENDLEITKNRQNL